MKTTSVELYWNATRQNSGQIVTEMYPQMHGAAEGNEGPAKGLRLTYDACDGEWVLRKGKREIARGNRFTGQSQPTVAEAMKLASVR